VSFALTARSIRMGKKLRIRALTKCRAACWKWSRTSVDRAGRQAWCLTVLTNSVITWTTEYYQITVPQLRAQAGHAR
jgi:hypothetical protein